MVSYLRTIISGKDLLHYNAHNIFIHAIIAITLFLAVRILLRPHKRDMFVVILYEDLKN